MNVISKLLIRAQKVRSSQVVAEISRGKVFFRYRDENGNLLWAWSGLPLFEKGGSLDVCLYLVASGSRGAFKLPESCANDLHYQEIDEQLKAERGLQVVKVKA